MAFSTFFSTILLLGSAFYPHQTYAAPLTNTRISPRQDGFSTLSTPEIQSFRPFGFFAAAGYCQPAKILSWSCGTNCDANQNFEPIAAGGDGDEVQFWFVGIDSVLETVIVSHQGTDRKKIMPILTDLNFDLEELDSTLFPGISKDIKVHDGFASQQAKTANDVLAAVKTALNKSGFKKVTCVGHSLGAALAVLDSVFLPPKLPGITFSTIGYGLPRVGNQAFADFVDANLNLVHINNQKDPVPTVPGRFLGFVHPQGERHIQEDASWVACPGQDNEDERCIVGDVGNILEANVDNHNGPYDIVTMGSKSCDA